MSKYDNNTIILIAGKAGAGKSTTGKIIRQIVGCHSRTSSFATPLKQMAANVLGVDVSKFDDYDFKNTHRPLLIALADSYKTLYGEDVFARKNVQAILDSEALTGIVVADDTRYPYEHTAMAGTFTNVILLEIVAPDREQAGIEHHSESTDWVKVDVPNKVVLFNDSTIDALRDKLKLILPSFGISVLRDEFIQELPQS